MYVILSRMADTLPNRVCVWEKAKIFGGSENFELRQEGRVRPKCSTNFTSMKKTFKIRASQWGAQGGPWGKQTPCQLYPHHVLSFSWSLSSVPLASTPSLSILLSLLVCDQGGPNICQAPGLSSSQMHAPVCCPANPFVYCCKRIVGLLPISPESTSVSLFKIWQPQIICGSYKNPWVGNSNLFQYPCLENSMDRGGYSGLSSMGSQRVRHKNSTLLYIAYLLHSWPFLLFWHHKSFSLSPATHHPASALPHTTSLTT